MHCICIQGARFALLAVRCAGSVAAAPSLVLVNGKLCDGRTTDTAVTAPSVEWSSQGW
jgi:hypothetical protein